MVFYIKKKTKATDNNTEHGAEFFIDLDIIPLCQQWQVGVMAH